MAYIKEEEINAIRQSADIVDIISSYLPVTQKGKNYFALCPFHDDHSPSLVISKERQIFNCFTCRTGGNVFSFVMKYENVDFPEALAIVAKKIGYNINISNFVKDSTYNKKEYEIMNFASKYFANNINTDSGLDARSYLKNRGIDESIIKEFKIGLALNEKDTLYKLLSKKYDLDTLENLGLINKYELDVYDAFTNRIMIPIEDLNGHVVAFTGRIYHNEDKAKYINTKETPIFKKGSILFNYHNARNYIRDAKKAIVVEGNMDAIKVSASGIKNVLALMGVALSSEQINVLKKLRVPVCLILDNDSAGLDATVKLGEVLTSNGIDVEVVRLSGAKDPDEYIRAFGVDALKDNINHAIKYIDFKLEYLKENKNLNNMEDLIVYVKEVLSSLKNTDDLTKELVISKISKDYEIDINILKKEILKDSKKEVVKSGSEKKQVTTKKSKYDMAASKVLKAMMEDSKYITIYKNRLGYFKNKDERILASEIIYYNNKNNGINIADFTSFIMNNEEVYEKAMNILSDDATSIESTEEFNHYIDVILQIYEKSKIDELKEAIKKEMDVNKKMELIEKLTEIKKGCVDNERN